LSATGEKNLRQRELFELSAPVPLLELSTPAFTVSPFEVTG
jgi:hypothetical protein